MVQSIVALRRREAELEREYTHYARIASKLFSRLSGIAPVDQAPVSDREYRYYSQSAMVLRRKLDAVRYALDIAEARAI